MIRSRRYSGVAFSKRQVEGFVPAELAFCVEKRTSFCAARPLFHHTRRRSSKSRRKVRRMDDSEADPEFPPDSTIMLRTGAKGKSGRRRLGRNRPAKPRSKPPVPCFERGTLARGVRARTSGFPSGCDDHVTRSCCCWNVSRLRRKQRGRTAPPPFGLSLQRTDYTLERAHRVLVLRCPH